VIARPAFAYASATWDDHVPTKTEEEASFKAAQQHVMHLLAGISGTAST
jgi:hypothetical protein